MMTGRKLQAEELLEDLYCAYFDARKNKRGTASQLRFELNLERNLSVLAREISTGHYEVGRSICFVVDKPVKREIFAADFRDRVVHHLLFNWLSPMLERSFVADSYSCRKGKGTLYGIERTRKHIRQCTCNFTQTAYVLKVDISGYFMSINRQRLLDTILTEMEKYRHRRCGRGKMTWEERIDYTLATDLLRKVILNDPTQNCIFRGNRSAWNGLPANKSLFNSEEGCGLPIGNLTSQLFSNVYLSAFDNRMKREEGLRYYGRYVDDIIIVHPDSHYLAQLLGRMERILKTDYGLTMHPRKRLLQRADQGFDFLGMREHGSVLLPGRRLKRGLRYSLDAYAYEMETKCLSYERFCHHRAQLNSYIGLMGHCCAGRLIEGVRKRLLNCVQCRKEEDAFVSLSGMGNVRTSVAGENKDNVPISFVRCLSLRPMVKGLGYVMNRAAVVFIFHTLFY